MKKLILLLFCSFTIFAQNWQTLQTVNTCTNRHENAMVAIGNQLVLVGGRGIKAVETFDLKTKIWTKRAETPLEFNHFQAIAYHGELWVMGAFIGGYPHEKPVSTIYIFNLEKNEWRKGAEIPAERLRGSAGVFVYQDKIYMVCGIQDGHWDGHVAWLDEFDPATGLWQKLADAPHTRDHIQAVVVDDRIYLAAGRRSTAKTNQVLTLTEAAVDVYDFKTKSWTTLPESLNLPTLRAGSSNVVLGKKIYVIGGESASQTESHADVEVFDTKTQSWTKNPKLQKGRHGTGAAVVKKKIYTAAGSGNRGGGPELNSVEVLEK
jgi:N-acetylneuraminic acid mutarotase